MISRSGNGNFVVQHYDWIAAGLGLAALAVAVAFCLLGESAEEEISAVVGEVSSADSGKPTVDEVNMRGYMAASNAVQTGRRYEFVTTKSAALFGSEKRMICASETCGKATPLKYDAARNVVCASCGYTQEVAKVIVAADTDKDGMPDDWERKYGLNPHSATDADLDKDGDDFTNLEEFRAKTDPMDKTSHPDYLDGLRIQLPLRETYMPFIFLSANKIPTGWRCVFFDAKQKDDYGRAGKTLTALIGEEVGMSDFVLKAYEQKEAKREIAGGKGMTKNVDVSEVTLERKKDGKQIKLVLAPNKRAKPVSVDVQATLVYERRATKTFEVVTGAEIVLSGTKYRIDAIIPVTKGEKKGAKAVVCDIRTGQKRTLEALEP